MLQAKLKAPNTIKYSKKNDVHPFDDATPLEFFSDKSDAPLFVFGSHSSKRPNNLVLGRLFNYKMLDIFINSLSFIVLYLLCCLLMTGLMLTHFTFDIIYIWLSLESKSLNQWIHLRYLSFETHFKVSIIDWLLFVITNRFPNTISAAVQVLYFKVKSLTPIPTWDKLQIWF